VRSATAEFISASKAAREADNARLWGQGIEALPAHHPSLFAMQFENFFER
jgi:hypothetical protein